MLIILMKLQGVVKHIIASFNCQSHPLSKMDLVYPVPTNESLRIEYERYNSRVKKMAFLNVIENNGNLR